MKTWTYRHTAAASYAGYVTQAVVNNLAPLLFVTFQTQFALSLPQLTLLISLNFAVQLLTDLAATKFVDRIGYRAAAVWAHFLCAAGLVLMGVLPYLLPSAYAGLVIAIAVNAVGGGIIEVIISPIVEAIPGERKAAAMSMLHSFYCWGFVAVVLISTLFFTAAGTSAWRYLAIAWAALPFLNALLFLKAPLAPLIGEGEAPAPVRKLFTRKTFLLLFAMMLCAGASEQAMSQWASLFAESGLQVTKTMGDLLGPCLFAVLMGLARLFFGLKQREIKLENVLMISSVLCIGSYLLTSFSPLPLLALVGCGLCGLSVGVMWPGTISLASRHFPLGGTALFAILALAGDLGCATGPGLVGAVMEAASLNAGILAAILFPALLVLVVILLRRRRLRRRGLR